MPPTPPFAVSAARAVLLALAAGCTASSPVLPTAPGDDVPTAPDDDTPTAPGEEPIETIGPAGASPEEDPSDAVFDPAVVHRIDLTLDAAAWADLRDNPWAEAWWTGDFALDGESIGEVGFRAYGGASHVPGKPNLKIGFDREVAGREFLGLEQLKLDASTQDPGFLNEAVATDVLRDLGLPAARTGWAVVYANGEKVGFYVLLEPMDDTFIRRWFGNDDGVLYGTTSYMYAQGLNRFTTSSPLSWYVVTFGEGDGSDIAAAADAIALGTREELEALVDTETSMRISATRAMMGSTDSFVADGNNFYLYNHQGRIVVLPWDFDVELAGYSPVFWNMVEMEMERPWEYSHWRTNSLTGEIYTEPLYARMLAEGWDLDGWMATAAAGPLDWAAVDARVQALAAVIDTDACADAYHSCASHRQRVADLRFFLHTRLSRLAGGEVADCSGPTGLAFSGSVGSGSLLVDTSEWAPGLVVNGEHHCTGVYAHAPSEVVTTVTAGTFSGAVGLHDANGTCGDGVVFSLVQDGAVLWTSGTVAGYEDAVPFAVPVGAGALTLRSDARGDNACDRSVWVDVAVE